MCRGHRISDDVEPFRLRSGWVFVYRVCRQAEGPGFPNRSNLSMSVMAIYRQLRTLEEGSDCGGDSLRMCQVAIFCV